MAESTEAGGQLPTDAEMDRFMDAMGEAGGQEREALTWGEYVSRSARYRAAEAEAAHLREALRWIERKARHKDGASLGELSSRLYDIGYHAAFALSQATKREHVGDIRGVPIVTDPSMEPGKIQARATKREKWSWEE